MSPNLAVDNKENQQLKLGRIRQIGAESATQTQPKNQGDSIPKRWEPQPNLNLVVEKNGAGDRDRTGDVQLGKIHCELKAESLRVNGFNFRRLNALWFQLPALVLL
jgi:hypothetical protein